MSSPSAGPRRRLFHVEDSAELRTRISAELEKIAGIELVGFSGGAADAIRQIRSLAPDLIVLDLQLEDGSGIDILRALNSLPRPPVVIVLTNHAEPRFRDLSIRAGAQYFFDKTTQLESFIACIERLAS